MDNTNPSKMSNQDLEKDMENTNTGGSKTHHFPDEDTPLPAGTEYDPADEVDLDELVHTQEDSQDGSLPDPDSLSLDEDDEFERDRIDNK